MTVAHPLVSVLMTAYNREKYIGEAIQSVLASTYENYELIIVDDCSSDTTVAIANSYAKNDNRIKVFVNEKNLGDYPNRNQAASYAIGKYIKYLDSDDVMYPHCLEVMISAMEKFPESGYALSSNGDSKLPYPSIVSPHDAYIEHFNDFGHFHRSPGSSIINKKVFDKLGGFKIDQFISDTVFWFEISTHYNLVKIQRDLVWDRAHTNSEKVYEQRNTAMHEVRKNMELKYLMGINCPLNEKEISNILKSLKRNNLKNLLKNLLNINFT